MSFHTPVPAHRLDKPPARPVSPSKHADEADEDAISAISFVDPRSGTPADLGDTSGDADADADADADVLTHASAAIAAEAFSDGRSLSRDTRFGEAPSGPDDDDDASGHDSERRPRWPSNAAATAAPAPTRPWGAHGYFQPPPPPYGRTREPVTAAAAVAVDASGVFSDLGATDVGNVTSHYDTSAAFYNPNQTADFPSDFAVDRLSDESGLDVSLPKTPMMARSASPSESEGDDAPLVPRTPLAAAAQRRQQQHHHQQEALADAAYATPGLPVRSESTATTQPRDSPALAQAPSEGFASATRSMAMATPSAPAHVTHVARTPSATAMQRYHLPLLEESYDQSMLSHDASFETAPVRSPTTKGHPHGRLGMDSGKAPFRHLLASASAGANLGAPSPTASLAASGHGHADAGQAEAFRQALGLRQRDQVMDAMKKENFELKLRIYFLEEQLAKSMPEAMDGGSQGDPAPDGEISRLVRQLQDDAEHYRGEADQAQAALRELQTRAETQAETMTQLQRTLAMHEEDHELLRCENEELRRYRDAHHADVASHVSAEVEALSNERDALLSKQAAQQSVIDAQSTELTDLRQSVSALEQEVFQLQQQNDAQRERAAQQEEDHESAMQKQLAEMEAQQRRHEASTQALNAELATLQAQCQDATHLGGELTRELESALNDVERLRQRERDLSAASDALQREHAQRLQQHAREWQARLDTQRHAHDDRLRSLEQAHAAEISRLTTRQHALEDELQQRLDDLQQLQQQQQQQARVHASEETREREHLDRQERLERQWQARLDAQRDDAEARVAALSARHDAAVRALEQEHHQMQQELQQALDTQQVEMAQQSRAWEARLAAQRDDAAAELAALRDAQADAVEALEAQLDTLRAERDRAMEQAHAAERAARPVTSSGSRAAEERERERLERQWQARLDVQRDDFVAQFEALKQEHAAAIERIMQRHHEIQQQQQERIEQQQQMRSSTASHHTATTTTTTATTAAATASTREPAISPTLVIEYEARLKQQADQAARESQRLLQRIHELEKATAASPPSASASASATHAALGNVSMVSAFEYILQGDIEAEYSQLRDQIEELNSRLSRRTQDADSLLRDLDEKALRHQHDVSQLASETSTRPPTRTHSPSRSTRRFSSRGAHESVSAAEASDLRQNSEADDRRDSVTTVQHIMQLQTALSERSSDAMEARAQLESLQQQSRASLDDLDAYKATIAQQQRQLDVLKREMARTETENTAFAEEVRRLDRACQRANQEASETRTELDAAHQQVNHLYGKLKAMIADQTRHATDRVINWQQRYEETRALLESTRAEQQAAESQLTALRRAANQRRDQAAQTAMVTTVSTSTMTMTPTPLANAAATAADVAAPASTVDRAQAEAEQAALRAELRQNRERLTDVTAQVEHRSRRIEQLEAQLSDLRTRLEAAQHGEQAARQSAHERAAAQTTQLRTAREQLQHEQDAANQLRSEVAALKQAAQAAQTAQGETVLALRSELRSTLDALRDVIPAEFLPKSATRATSAQTDALASSASSTSASASPSTAQTSVKTEIHLIRECLQGFQVAMLERTRLRSELETLTARFTAEIRKMHASIDPKLAGIGRLEAMVDQSLAAQQGGRVSEADFEKRLAQERANQAVLRGRLDVAQQAAETAESRLADARARIRDLERREGQLSAASDKETMQLQQMEQRLATLQTQLTVEREAAARRIHDVLAHKSRIERELQTSEQRAEQLETKRAAAKEAVHRFQAMHAQQKELEQSVRQLTIQLDQQVSDTRQREAMLTESQRQTERAAKDTAYFRGLVLRLREKIKKAHVMLSLLNERGAQLTVPVALDCANHVRVYLISAIAQLDTSILGASSAHDVSAAHDRASPSRRLFTTASGVETPADASLAPHQSRAPSPERHGERHAERSHHHHHHAHHHQPPSSRSRDQTPRAAMSQTAARQTAGRSASRASRRLSRSPMRDCQGVAQTFFQGIGQGAASEFSLRSMHIESTP
ncbi:hypothetical protein CXG81DRAFT_24568 [Caulochytrium protostelioides]|uniref:Centrosomin N-terminal motif 1 domain-containing protein n=1 Tax=Caulochytrium protostelioides TaxID=1555241 RepID=A0A4P9XC85_9FUNG|nr:hypothetical protein CXG81DRAFT_24568 [Caulochytrium protostelioides]|eukprot:RKP02780.1 hypothetical protein CXG81DRAFT_24568 [Caulochytrium protostelioides]